VNGIAERIWKADIYIKLERKERKMQIRSNIGKQKRL
jgi:hypothetical protein